jgi:hypothetical protein
MTPEERRAYREGLRNRQGDAPAGQRPNIERHSPGRR